MESVKQNNKRFMYPLNRYARATSIQEERKKHTNRDNDNNKNEKKNGMCVRNVCVLSCTQHRSHRP